MNDGNSPVKKHDSHSLVKWFLSPFFYVVSGLLIPYIVVLFPSGISEEAIILLAITIFYLANIFLVRIEGMVRPVALDHARQSIGWYCALLVISGFFLFSIGDNWTVPAFVVSLIPLLAIIINAVFLYWRYLSLSFGLSIRLRKFSLFCVGIILICVGLHFWFSLESDKYRTTNARNSYLEIYAGCHARAFNLVSYEPNPEKPMQTIGMRAANNYWKQDSQEWHFNHNDVVEYMMQHCPPKSDVEIEKVYSDSSEKDIEHARARRDYQLKFIDKDLDVFRE